MCVVSVRAHHFDFSIWGGFGEREENLPLVTPMSIYPRFKHPITSWHAPAGTCVVEVEADDGRVGLGWCEDFCGAASVIIERHLSRFLLNQDPRDVSQIWDQMYRSSIMYGRKGLAVFAISALDIALWDLIGKQAGTPVYRLLGGKVRDTVPVYASHLHAIEPEKLAAEARDYVQRGYRAMKMRFGFGPADGLEGMNKNVAQVALLRETVGDSVDLMADAYMGWTVEYTQRIAKKLERFDLKWLEEPLLPDEIEGYIELSRTIGVPVAAGEHEYTRYGFQTLIRNRAIRFVQFDLGRVGGLTEAKRVCQMASAAGLPVCPHAYSLPTLHLVVSEPACLMAEHFPVPCWMEDGYMDRNPFGTPQPQSGTLALPEEPGLGTHLDFDLRSGSSVA
jgi:L-alanine-DL-glutamate epimerase-like enolase superfamily enzyme